MTVPEGYSIRPADNCDVHSVLELSRLWAAEGCTTGYVACTAEQVLHWLQHGYCFVAELVGEVIAYAAGESKLGKGVIFAPEGERYVNIDEVFVKAGHRDRGVGTQLVRALLGKAETDGVERAMVGSNNADWLPTFQFYERQGFRMFSIQMYK